MQSNSKIAQDLSVHQPGVDQGKMLEVDFLKVVLEFGNIYARVRHERMK